MPEMTDAFGWYDANAEAVAAEYERLAFEDVHGWLLDLLPSIPATVMDVGAGSGRDAAWLAERGYDVLAAEPSEGMRTLAARMHPESQVHWSEDSLPALKAITSSGLSFDLILLSAVWMHVPSSQRPRAFRKLMNLLKPGGLIALTLRNGPAEPGRNFHPSSLAELKMLARHHGAFVEFSGEAKDQLKRDGVSWTQVVCTENLIRFF